MMRHQQKVQHFSADLLGHSLNKICETWNTFYLNSYCDKDILVLSSIFIGNGKFQLKYLSWGVIL